MTTVMIDGFGWVSIVLVLAWYTQKLVGYYAGMPCTAKHGLEALDMAVNRQSPNGARGQGVLLLSDNGGQPTSLAFMRAGATLEIPQAFTSYHNPKGTADTERGMRTLKEEGRWRHAWTGPFALVKALAAWIDSDHEHYLPSTLGYKTPRPCARADYACPRTPFAAA
jgi:putative transposase